MSHIKSETFRLPNLGGWVNKSGVTGRTLHGGKVFKTEHHAVAAAKKLSKGSGSRLFEKRSRNR